jgi:hypothetical protein
MTGNAFQHFEAAIARFYNSQGIVIGAGFLVADQTVLTCAHVVAAALGLADTQPERPTGIVELDFPLDAM